MRIGTPRAVERSLSFRAGLHFYRWGFHAKVRLGLTWHHFSVKFMRGSALGQRGRRQLWCGWWSSRKGERGPLSGYRFGVYMDRMVKLRPTEKMQVPIYPTKPRDREARFEVR